MRGWLTRSADNERNVEAPTTKGAARQDALQRGLKRYRGKVCAKHPNLKGERMMHGACVGCARDLKRSPKYRARQRVYKRSPEYLARQRARQITPEFRARRNARNRARRIARD
jgi:hypothetical protein